MTSTFRSPKHLAAAKTKVRILLGLIPALMVALTIESMPFAHAQNFATLYAFPRQSAGYSPAAGRVRDQAGNLYGTTSTGGESDDCCGIVFKLYKAGNETLLHAFAGLSDGTDPKSALIFDALGNLYGTTATGGGKHGRRHGVVFKLDKAGRETAVYSFSGGADGALPRARLARDAAGNLYGTTIYGGLGHGVVFKIDRAGKETVLHSFSGGLDGATPYAGLILDDKGNLYGATAEGGRSGCFMNQGCGTVFKIDTKGKKTVLYRFGRRANDGENPYGDLLRDDSGNLYGTTFNGGLVNGCQYGCGTVFEITPSGHETVLYRFLGGNDGDFPVSGVVRDAAGNLYGTTVAGGLGLCQKTWGNCGTIFKLDSRGKGTILYRFMNSTDGATPMAGLLLDTHGTLYGTTSAGGDFNCDPQFGCGTVFRFKP